MVIVVMVMEVMVIVMMWYVVATDNCETHFRGVAFHGYREPHNGDGETRSRQTG